MVCKQSNFLPPSDQTPNYQLKHPESDETSGELISVCDELSDEVVE